MTADLDAPFTTAQVPTPRRIIDQVIGQEHCVAMARLAARQRRGLLLIGEPGTGKSLIGRAMAELLPRDAEPLRISALAPNPEDSMRPRHVVLTPQAWATRCDAVQRMDTARARTRDLVAGAGLISLLLAGLVVAYHQKALATFGMAVLPTLIFAGASWKRSRAPKKHGSSLLPKVLVPLSPDVPCIDATGLTEGALFGDVRHDPYQSGGQETPPHLLVEPGAIHRAHGGILYIDEIATLSQADQRLLLTALQDKALPIAGRCGGSSGALVQTDPIPCDFILVAAGHEDDVRGLLPGLRSRMRGLGYEVKTSCEMPDTPANRTAMVRFIAQEVAKDGRIPPFEESGVQGILAVARATAEKDASLTLRLRELGGVIRLAGDMAVNEGAGLVSSAHVHQAWETLIPWEQSLPRKESDGMRPSEALRRPRLCPESQPSWRQEMPL